MNDLRSLEVVEMIAGLSQPARPVDPDQCNFSDICVCCRQGLFRGQQLCTEDVQRPRKRRQPALANSSAAESSNSCIFVPCCTAEFVKNRVAMQEEHMQTIWREFDGSVRAIVPLFEQEVRGVPMLERLCDAIFVANGVKPVPQAAPGRLEQVGA